MQKSKQKKVIKAAEKVGISKKPIAVVRKEKFQERKYNFNLLAVVAITTLVILSVLVKLNPNNATDLLVTRFLQKITFTPFSQLMYFISVPGNSFYRFILLFAVFGFTYIRKRRKEAWALLIGSLGAEFTSIIMKHIVSRNRPDPKLITSVLHLTKPDSFPSGHVLFYVGFFGILLFLIYSLIPKSLLRKVLVGICLFFIVLIGPSRIYLGAHWLSDVLGAYLAGFLWVYFTVYFYTKDKLKK